MTTPSTSGKPKLPQRAAAQTPTASAQPAPAPQRAAAPTAGGFSFTLDASGETIDEGSYQARIAGVAALGVQPPMTGSTSPPRAQVAVAFELFGATAAGYPLEAAPLMWRRFNITSGPRAELPRLLRAILGRDPAPGETLRPAEWVGVAVAVTVEHQARGDGSTSARIGSVTRTTAAVPELTAEPVIYPGRTRLADLPEWARSAIAGQLHAAPATGDADRADY